MKSHLKKHHLQKPGNRQKICAMHLVPGEWKKMFNEGQYYRLVAECLNMCVYKDGLKINGYLITATGIYLVLGNPHEATQKLALFFEGIKKAITHRHAQNGYQDAHNQITLYHLFRKLPFLNIQLIKLLTARPVALLYYDAVLERQKKRLAQEYYCSVNDYTGAKGPVAVTPIPHDEDIQLIPAPNVKDEYLFE